MDMPQTCFRPKTGTRSGFTVVELAIAIVVVAILATIAIVSYDGVQKRTASVAVIDSLKKATDAVLIEEVRREAVPESIDGLFTPSADVELVYSSAPSGEFPRYEGLDAPQNGKLFANICSELVDDGLGQGLNDFGSNTIEYIQWCRAWDFHYFQINGWNGGFNISNPSLTEELLRDYFAEGIANHPDHPNYHATIGTFMNTLIARFKAQGGSFPVTFWQPWNGDPTLPPPSSSASSSGGFCIIARSTKYGDVSYVATMNNPEPREGAEC